LSAAAFLFRETENMEQKRASFKTAELAYIALGAALITVCAWITIPFTVPFTMQIFAVFFSLILLGGRNGTLCVAVYLLLGAIGIPVFSGGKGGFSVLVGMTGGYLWGMLLIGMGYWIFTKLFGKKLWAEIVSLVFGLLLCYMFGTVWFTVLNADHGFASALMICVVPFLLPDAAKLALALVLGRKLRKLIPVS
jgi:biotin transport system substrate-specific component